MYLICDIDDTVSTPEHRRHLLEGPNPSWEEFLKPELVAQDAVIPGVKEKIHKWLGYGHGLIFLTGRSEVLREVTEKWLKDNLGLNVAEYEKCKKNPDQFQIPLFMRPSKDNQPASKCKNDLLADISDCYDRIQGKCVAIDDDPYLSNVYASWGLVPLQAPEAWKTFMVDTPEEPEVVWGKK